MNHLSLKSSSFIECNATTWGEDCGQTCSSQCLDKHCDAMTSMCKDCVPGYHGDWCDRAEPLRDEGGGWSNIPMVVGSLVTVLGIFTIAAAVLLWRCFKARTVCGTGQEEKSTVMFKVLEDETSYYANSMDILLYK